MQPHKSQNYPQLRDAWIQWNSELNDVENKRAHYSTTVRT